jgi:hypothetical protein
MGFWKDLFLGEEYDPTKHCPRCWDDRKAVVRTSFKRVNHSDYATVCPECKWNNYDPDMYSTC